MRKKLCVGGPADGQLVDIHQDREAFHAVPSLPVNYIEDKAQEMVPVCTYVRAWVGRDHELWVREEAIQKRPLQSESWVYFGALVRQWCRELAEDNRRYKEYYGD